MNKITRRSLTALIATVAFIGASASAEGTEFENVPACDPYGWYFASTCAFRSEAGQLLEVCWSDDEYGHIVISEQLSGERTCERLSLHADKLENPEHEWCGPGPSYDGDASDTSTVWNDPYEVTGSAASSDYGCAQPLDSWTEGYAQ